MKVSIVNAILNSPEIARRQILHYNQMKLPSDVEVIFVDDGSEPPLEVQTLGAYPNFNFMLFHTHDKRRWTQPLARNLGARQAKGDFCIFTDIDHIITKELINRARTCPFDVLRLKREAAVLDEDGNLTQSHDVLRSYGLTERYFKRGLRLPPHGNSYIFRRSLYLDLGGVSTHFVGSGKYPNREEVPLKRKLKILAIQGKVSICDDDRRPIIYMIPNGKYCGDKDFNPFGLFHNLSRKTNKEKRGSRSYKRTNKERLQNRIVYG